MIKYFTCFFLLIFYTLFQCDAQYAIINTIKQTNPKSKEVYIFPKVVLPKKKIASKKINNSLLEFLGVENGEYKKSIFEHVWERNNENFNWVYHDLNFKAVGNTNKILAINFWATFGKHNTENTEHYLFNNKTGSSIILNALIAESKKKALAKLLYNKKDSIIKSFFLSVKDSLELHTKLGDDANIKKDLYQLDVYDRCLERYEENEVSLEYIDFYYEKK
jgi:hypothetical protein